MLTRTQVSAAQKRAAAFIREAGLPVSAQEESLIDIVDFGLSHHEEEGIQVLTWFATERQAAKVLVLFPNQTEPEHWHPPVGKDPGKEEIIRGIRGQVRFYVPGPDTFRTGFVPPGKEDVYVCRHEVLVGPGEQLILAPGTKHWFQAGPEGAVFFSFSTCVRDGLDGFTDPAIVRQTVIVED